MKYVDNILYIEYFELLEAGFKLNHLRSARSRNSSGFNFLDDPEDARKSLLEYKELPEKYKELIVKRFGNPFDYVAQQPLKAMVKFDEKAEAFYLDYRYSEDNKLSKEVVDKYTKSASWLNMITECLADKKDLKKRLHVTIDQFFTNVFSLIKTENIDLPTSHKRMKMRLKEYQENSYSALIHKNYGNSHSAKVDDVTAINVLLELIAHPNQYDDVIIANQYNLWAISQGKKQITSQTVGLKRRDNNHVISMSRNGLAEWKGKYSRNIRGMRPSQPLYLIENDDWDLDLWFTDGQSDFVRYTAIVIVDSSNDYVLGYAYSTNHTADLTRAAYMNALNHIKELTGEYHLPHELKSDKWSIKNLTPFYEKVAERIEPRLGNKQRGYIEQVFGRNFTKNCLKIGANNYTGNNITASKRGVNTDKLSENKRFRPKVGVESIEQIENVFNRLRHWKPINGVSRQEKWLESWSRVPEESKKPLTEEQYFMKFGLEYNGKGRGLTLTNSGLDFQMNKQQYSYQTLDFNPALMGTKVSVLYDPFNMSRIMVTDHNKIRLIAKETTFMPRAQADHTDATKDYLFALLENQNKHANSVAEKNMEREKFLKQNSISAESIMQAGILDKETKSIAERKILQQLTEPTTNTGGSILDQI